MDYNKKPSLLKSGKTAGNGGQGFGIKLDPPPENSFFYEQWNQNYPIFEDIKRSNFAEGIKAKNLNPTNYGTFGVQQINISFDFINGLESAKSRIDQDQDPELVAIYDTLISYLTTLEKWNLANNEPLSATANYTNYLQDFQNLVNDPDVHPVYIVAVLLPRFHIQYELAQYLQPEAEMNVYQVWINKNISPDTAYAIGNFIDAWVAAGKEFDMDLAISYYSRAFYYEYVGYQDTASSSTLRYVFKY